MKNNLALGLSWFGRNLPNGRIFKEGDLIYADSDLPSEIINVIWGAPNSPEATSIITNYLQSRHLTASWWLPSDVRTPAAWWLADNGWEVADVLIAMALTPQTVNPRLHLLPEGLSVRPCREYRQVTDFSLVLSSIFLPERPQEAAALNLACGQAAKAMVDGADGFQAWLAYLDDTPVSALYVIKDGRQAGFYGITTRPEFQGRGLAQAAVGHVLGALMDDCDLITLQAVSRGVNIFADLGFISVNQFVVWRNLAAL